MPAEDVVMPAAGGGWAASPWLAWHGIAYMKVTISGVSATQREVSPGMLTSECGRADESSGPPLNYSNGSPVNIRACV